MLRRLVFTLPLLFALSSSSAWAQRAEITPFVGYRFGGGVNLEGLAIDLDLASDVSYGFTVDVSVTDNVQIEFLYSRQKSLLEARGVGIGGPAKVPIDELNVDYWHGGVVYNWNDPGSAIRPFFLGTLGATVFDPVVEGLGSDTKFSLGFGGGVKFFASDHIGARVEFRGFSTNTDLSQTGWVCGYYDCFLVSGTQSIWQGEFRGGLIIAF